MNFIKESISKYSEHHTSRESDLLEELNRETHLKVLQPRMLSGHIQGRVLSMLSKIHRPKNILEIGTYTGYSALCLAEGLDDEGVLHTIDINEELHEMVLRYIEKAGMTGKITPHVGNALDLIPALDKSWDLVFIDADKENYVNYYNLVIDRMNPGGLIIADNVLWSGKVVEATQKADHETETLKQYNKMVRDDDRVENVLFTVRDGLLVARVR